MMTVPDIYCADKAIYRVFKNFYKIRLDCFVASLLAMTANRVRAAYDACKLLVQTICKCCIYLMTRFCIRTSLRAQRGNPVLSLYVAMRTHGQACIASLLAMTMGSLRGAYGGLV
jgi:hypothetical protein